MKKSMVVMVLCMLFLTLSAFAELPSPFEKIKQIALNAMPDKDGNCIVEKGNGAVYSFAYIPKLNIVGIGKSEGPFLFVVYWSGNDNQFIVRQFAYGALVGQGVVSREEAVEAAYKLFREAIKENLI